MTAKKSARQHARERGALDGVDAQALEGALSMTERERDEARRERDMWRSECASISEEFNLPAGIRPSEGEISRFLKDYEKARKERDEALAKYQFMVDRAANEKLDGYRELGSRLAAMEAERDEWIRRAREAVLAMNARPHRRECVRQSAYNIACVCGVSFEDEQP